MKAGRICMETIQHFIAMSAFCRQRSKMDGEDELFWLSEAELLAKLAINVERLRLLQLSEDGRAA
jgi:hypothetical protein